MSETSQSARLLAARWLLDGGAGASACRVLANVRGVVANDLREESATLSLRPGICALVVHEDQGLVFPLRTRVGLPSSASEDLRTACADALGAVRTWFGVATLPALRFELEELLAVSGTSLGLPAALAFVTHLAPASAPRRAVLATGRLDASGRVLPVAHLEAKLAAAAAEQGDRLVLVPPGQRTHDEHVEVSTLSEAIEAALGPSRAPLASLIAVDALIERARAESDPHAAVALLEAVDREALSAADRARVHLELGTVLRHTGRTDAAAEHHARARALFETERLVVGAETAERYELEVWLTAMDRFELDATRPALVSRLREPFLSVRNELRCRGMLAQLLSMQGDVAEAVRVREENLALHAKSDELSRVLPGTLCYLTLDSARAGDVDRFHRHGRHMLAATKPGDTTQWRYTAYAIVRGLVALGRHEEAIAWAGGTSTFDGVFAPPETVALLNGSAPIAHHPEITVARSLVRALRHVGSNDAAIALGTRVGVTRASEDADLVAWLARLVDLEVALAERAAGHYPDLRIAQARTDLAALHRAATQHHPDLLTCVLDDLEHALDRLFY